MIALVNIGGEMQDLEQTWWISLWLILCLILFTGIVVAAVVNHMRSEQCSRLEDFRLSDAKHLHGDLEFDADSALCEDEATDATCDYFGRHCFGPARDGIEQCEGCGHAREASGRS